MVCFIHIIVNTLYICDNKYNNNNNNNNNNNKLTDVSNSGDRNVTKKETEKTVKYKDLITEIRCMWNKKQK